MPGRDQIAGCAGYMREIGTMWQIGVLTGKPCILWSKMGHFRRFGNYKNKERLSRFGRRMAHSFYLS